jgi:hypothetical protein
LNDLGIDTSGKLANVGPISISAQVSAENDSYRVVDLEANLGGSDLAGTLSIALDGERPRLTGTLQSKLIDLRELAPYREGEPAAKTAPAEPLPYLIPDNRLPIEVLDIVDFDILITIAEFRTDIGKTIGGVSAKLKLADRRFEAAPLTGGFAGGEMYVRLLLDGREPPISMVFELQQRQMLVGTFVPILKSSGENVGRADIDIQLSGVGNTTHALAASLDGHLYVVAEGGAVDSRLLGTLAIGIGDILAPFIRQQGNTSLNCFVAGLDFESGLITSRTLLVDLPTLSVAGTGTVDLNNERIDLRFATRARNVSLASLAAPFNVTGTLASPRAQADRAGTALRAVGGVLNPVAALGTLAALGAGRSVGRNPCVQAMREAQAAAAGDESAEAVQAKEQGATNEGAQGNTDERRRFGRRLRGLFGEAPK